MTMSTFLPFCVAVTVAWFEKSSSAWALRGASVTNATEAASPRAAAIEWPSFMSRLLRGPIAQGESTMDGSAVSLLCGRNHASNVVLNTPEMRERFEHTVDLRRTTGRITPHTVAYV